MVRRNNGAYYLDHAVTKKQKDILAAFGLDVVSGTEKEAVEYNQTQGIYQKMVGVFLI